MGDALDFILNLIVRLFSLLDAITFKLFTFDVSFLGVIFAFLVLGLVANIWWKGGKT